MSRPMESAVHPLKGKSILLVEDHRDLADVLSRLLAFTGIRVAHADSGSKVFRTLRRDVPDLILLDLMLPDMDGLEIVTFVRQDETLKHIPIVVFTGSFGRREECLQRGCDDFIMKPFNSAELLRRLSALLQDKGGS
jgi:CheY-like chemotaxis protein